VEPAAAAAPAADVAEQQPAAASQSKEEEIEALLVSLKPLFVNPTCHPHIALDAAV
jgi:hypothetical protein